MKLTTLIAASTLALAIAGTASAQTKIYVTGSTAFRAATVNAITSVVGVSPTAFDGSSSGVTSATNANAVTWTGGSIGGQSVTVKASWSGSAAGIQSVAGAPSFTVRFLPDGASGATNADPRATGNPAESAVPDIAMADNQQTNTFFNGTFNNVTYASLSDEIVGVIPFRWVASNGFPANQSMTPQLAQYLFGAGTIPLAMWSGASADRNKLVYATGRDPDSGTRIISFAESGIGAFSVVKQWKPTAFLDDATVSGVDTSIVSDQSLYPVQTINGVSTGTSGNSGESSGSTLRGYLNKTLNSAAVSKNDPNGDGNAGYYVTYLGASDASSTLSSSVKPAVALKWNGVDFSTAAVIDGSYSFWGYEHLLHRTLTAPKSTFANSLRDQLLATPTATLSPNVNFNDMKVSRSSDGGPIVADYF